MWVTEGGAWVTEGRRVGVGDRVEACVTEWRRVGMGDQEEACGHG